MTTVGVIGFGGFGKLVADSLRDTFSVKVYNRTMAKVPKHFQATLEEVCTCDYIVLSVPLGSYRKVLQDMAPLLSPDAVIVDVCSVKVKPTALITELLPRNPIVATHPLFGPQTVQDGFSGHTLAVCDDVSDAHHAQVVSEFAKGCGLTVVHLSSTEHDKQMAKVHALTFFIARALFNTDFTGVTLKTPSFERLMSLIELEHRHSEELFDTIESGNPFAREVRQQFLHDAAALAQELDVKGKI